MLETFLATLNPMLMLFLCIAIGFTLRKAKILPDSAGKTMAKLVTWVFYPALSFITLAKNCTVENLTTNATNLLLSCAVLALAIPVGILLARILIRKPSAERGVYQYALIFANSGYVGDPLVEAIFGSSMLAFYKLFTLPLSPVIYTWGVSALIPKDSRRENPVLAALTTPPTVATLLGAAAGLTGLGNILPDFLVSTLDGLKACMGPTAMLLAGFTVAGYGMKDMLTDKKVYLATALRLVVLPALLVAFLFGVKELANLVFGLSIDNTVLFLAFVAYAAPLGLNTVIFPEAYGGNPKTGAGMALVSHTLFVITMPLLFAVMFLLFGHT